MRTFNADEADSLVADIANFYDYTQVLLSNQDAEPDEIEPTLEPQIATSYLENTFNYFFARADYMLLQKVHDTLTYELPQDEYGKVSTREAGLVFNNARADIKNFYDGILEDDKKLTLVDVSYIEGELVVYVDVSYRTYPEVPLISNISFGVDDNWYIENYGGYVDASNNVQFRTFGSPSILRFYVLSNLGYIGAGTSSFPVNVTNTSVAPGGELVANTQLPTNPISTSAFTFWFTNTTLLKTNGTTYPQTNPPGLLPYQGMNYFREYGIPYHIDFVETTLQKTMIDFVLNWTFIPNGTYNRQHYFDFIKVADLVPVTPPVALSL